MMQAFTKARSSLRRAFSNKPNVIQTRSGASPLGVASMHSHWIVGRGLCIYRCESFHNVPRAKRRAALALKLPMWSPFENAGCHSVWAGPLAMVWIWNQADVDAARREHTFPGASEVRVLPEAVFLPKPPDGLHVQACAEGHDLQLWRAGVLQDAYWLAEPPTPETVAWFLERQSPETLPPSSEDRQPEGRPAHFESEPWAGFETPAQWLEARESALVATGLIALMLPLAWQEARIVKMQGLAETATQQMAEMQAELGPMLGAREQWQGLRERNQALGEILSEPSQAYVMGQVDAALPNADARFRDWRYQQRELRMVVEDDALDPVEYTRALEAQPLFGDVRMQPQRRAGQFEITLRVAP